MKLGKRILMLALVGTLALLPALSACGKKGGDAGDNGQNGGQNGGEQSQPENPNGPDDEEGKGPFTGPATYTITLGKDLTLALGGDYAASAFAPVVTRNDETLESPAITYSVADKSVATVSDDGAITAVAKGETTVTAYFSENDTVVSDTVKVHVLETTTKENVNSFSADYVNLFGRTYMSGAKLMLNNVCTGIEVSFAGTSLSLTFGRLNDCKIRTYLDGETAGTVHIVDENQRDPKITLYEGLDSGVHTVRILKASAPSGGTNGGRIEVAELDTDGDFCIPPAKPDFKMEIIGDSITQGVGAAGTSAQFTPTVENCDATLTYACLTAQALGADFSIMALEGTCVKDGGTRGYDFYTQTYPNGSKFDNSTFVPDVVVIGFGENDVWHATSDQFPNYNLEKFRADYADMIRLIRSIHPDAVIFCAYGMMPASARTEAKTAIQGAIADTGFEKVYDIRLTSNEAGANLHPNAKAHKSNADNLTKFIKEKLGL